ncbi:hypothetical protein SEA_CHUPACABRA_36 [Mycobacterium phage Chupacabra]|uniref:Uncharacterized protein n=3 Tax=Fromanvirus goose TaxID=1211282 RepID=A0A291AV00_9CAUD|nr:hypothetical protein FGG46_gp57 [Mycobacterium phage Goose]AFU20663.1 hypothetical protein GOOSE_37 [Mycobacterium phage Goose]ATE84779.1 hypothetical protein OKCENTRAL2016_36 [Mycobacterium phage OKCentral2016]QHB41219.1 hypothetical protein SEA_CHUPACABRA_36 [Mycobacterium phage Chupacabra]
MAKHRWPTLPIRDGFVFLYGGRRDRSGAVWVRWNQRTENLEPIK